MKKYIGTGIIIVAVAVAYFFIFYLPKNQQQNFIFNKQKECHDICEAIYKMEVESLPDGTVMNPKYIYNEDKNACYYSGGFIGTEKPFSISKHITNCLTNEEVSYYIEIDDKIFGDTKEEFNNKEKELMK
ncbi:MAG: hypothetical protein WCT37_02330 [Patescibacteria group bacterium]|jgi:hypothetical protein